MQPISVTDEEVVNMVLFPVVNEACRVLEDGVVVRASDLDVATLLGMSFPSFRSVFQYIDLFAAAFFNQVMLAYFILIWKVHSIYLSTKS